MCGEPTIIPDIRAHVGNWEHFQKVCGSWPTLSIVTFLFRFVLVTCVVGWAVWYGLATHGWTDNKYHLASLSVAILLVFFGFLWSALRGTTILEEKVFPHIRTFGR